MATNLFQNSEKVQADVNQHARWADNSLARMKSQPRPQLNPDFVPNFPRPVYTLNTSSPPIVNLKSLQYPVVSGEELAREAVFGNESADVYMFIEANKSLHFDEARSRCRQDFDPKAALCSFFQLDEAVGKGYNISGWGWASNLNAESTRGLYHTAKLTHNGPSDGGAQDVSTHKSNAHCCKGFAKFQVIKGLLLLEEARDICGSEFSGHLCSVDEVELAFAAGAYATTDVWGWTNTPSMEGDPNKNYNTARLWSKVTRGAEMETDAQNSLSWRGAAFCCRGLSLQSKPIRRMRSFAASLQVPQGHKRAGLFHSFYIDQARLLQTAPNAVHNTTNDTTSEATVTNAANITTANSTANITIVNTSNATVIFNASNTTASPITSASSNATAPTNVNATTNATNPITIPKPVLPWPDVPYRSRTYDNAVIDIGLILNGDEGDLELVLANLLALQSLLEDAGTPNGTKTIPFAFNLEGSSDPDWKSEVYRVAACAWVGQAMAMYELQTNDTRFHDDISRLAQWIIGQVESHGLIQGGIKNGKPIKEVTTEENIDTYFFLSIASKILGDWPYNYTLRSDQLAEVE